MKEIDAPIPFTVQTEYELSEKEEKKMQKFMDNVPDSVKEAFNA